MIQWITTFSLIPLLSLSLSFFLSNFPPPSHLLYSRCGLVIKVGHSLYLISPRNHDGFNRWAYYPTGQPQLLSENFQSLFSSVVRKLWNHESEILRDHDSNPMEQSVKSKLMRTQREAKRSGGGGGGRGGGRRRRRKGWRDEGREGGRDKHQILTASLKLGIATVCTIFVYEISPSFIK